MVALSEVEQDSEDPQISSSQARYDPGGEFELENVGMFNKKIE